MPMTEGQIDGEYIHSMFEKKQKISFFLRTFLQWLAWDFNKSPCVELSCYSSGKQQINGLESELSPCYLEAVYVLEAVE